MTPLDTLKLSNGPPLSAPARSALPSSPARRSQPGATVELFLNISDNVASRNLVLLFIPERHQIVEPLVLFCHTNSIGNE